MWIHMLMTGQRYLRPFHSTTGVSGMLSKGTNDNAQQEPQVTWEGIFCHKSCASSTSGTCSIRTSENWISIQRFVTSTLIDSMVLRNIANEGFTANKAESLTTSKSTTHTTDARINRRYNYVCHKYCQTLQIQTLHHPASLVRSKANAKWVHLPSTIQSADQ